MKQLFIFVSLLLICQISFSQLVTFPWNGTYGGTGTNRTYSTTVSGITMSAAINNSENVWQNSSPLYIASGTFPPGSSGCSAITATNQGVYLGTDWTTNTIKTITTTISFSSPVKGPVDFYLYDVNDDGFGSWLDKIVISGTNSATGSVNCYNVGTACVQTGGSVTGSGTATLTYNSGQSSACTCWGNNHVNVGTSSDCISSVTIRYQSGNTSYNNPFQYVIISNLTATIVSNTAPSGITGNTTICNGQSTTLTATGGTSTSQWFTGSCGGTLVGTGSSITVSPTTTATYYVQNAATACSAASACASTTVTVNPSPTAPTISASGPTTFCSGGSVTLTSSSVTGNTWSTGATTQSITVSTSGSYSVSLNSGGCSSTSATTTVTVNSNPAAPTITASGPTTFCSGSSVTLTSSSTSGNTWSTGATTQSITVNSSGTYTVSYVNSNGCTSATASQVVTVNPTPSTPTITASGPTTFCSGSSVTLTSSSVTGNTWSTGATTQSITVSTSGSYSVTVNSGGCSATSATITVTVNSNPAAPTITASGPTTFCSGSSVTLTSSSATGNTWSTGATTQSITVTSSGTYTLSYVDASGCTSATASQIVSVNTNPTSPTISASGPTVICQGGSVTLTSSSATGNTWSTGATTQSITVNNSGSYFVVVGASGCSANSDTIVVTVNSLPSTPSITASQTTLCSGQSATLTSSSTTGNAWSTGATTQSITVNSAGTYTLTATDANGCTSANASVTISSNPQPAAPTITANGPTTFCSGDSVVLTSSIVTGNNWSTGATTQSITVNSSGTYTLSYIDVNGCTSATASQIVSVNTNPTSPTISASGPTVICQGGSVTLTSSSATGNTWSTGATTQSITVNNSGSYFVVIGASGCSANSDTLVVTVNSLPSTPTITASQTTLCSGQSATLTSSSTTGNTWSTGATAQSITVNTAGTYTLTATDANGCTSANASVTITSNPQPAAPVISANGPTTFCVGGSVVLTSNQVIGNNWSTGATMQSITVTSSGTYTLSYVDASGCISASASQVVTVSSVLSTPVVNTNGPTTFCQGGSVILTSSSTSGNTWSTGATTQSITVNASGAYSVTVSASGCSTTSATTNVVVNPLPSAPSISTSQTALCSGQSATLTSSSTTGNAWSTGANSQSIVVTNAGTYTLNVTNANGCTSVNATVSISSNPQPVVPIITVNGPTTLCNGSTVTLTSSQSNGNTWSNGSTGQSISVSNAGTYSLTYVDANGCTSASANQTIIAGTSPTISVTNDTICEGTEMGILTATASIAGGSFVWTPSGSNNSTLSASPSVTTSYSVVYTLNGCSSNVASGTIFVLPAPVASFSFYPTRFSSNPQSISFTNNSTNGVNYSWNFGDGSTSTIENPEHLYNSTENGYMVILTATNSAGCSDEIQIGIGYVDGLDFYVPNCFTPDGDEYNNTFQPVFTSGFDPHNFHLMIFDRWGELIFESFDASKGWDGSYGKSGISAQDGIYTWKIEFKKPTVDERIKVVGHVTKLK